MSLVKELVDESFAHVEKRLDYAITKAAGVMPGPNYALKRASIISALLQDHIKRMAFLGTFESVEKTETIVEMVREASNFLALADALLSESERLGIRP